MFHESAPIAVVPRLPVRYTYREAISREVYRDDTLDHLHRKIYLIPANLCATFRDGSEPMYYLRT